VSRYFNGTSDKLTLAPPLSSGPLSVSLWFFADDISFGAANKFLWALADTALSNNYYGLLIKNSDKLLRGGWIEPAGSRLQESGSAVQINRWNHACLVVNSTTSVSVYLNGVAGISAATTSSTYPTSIDTETIGAVTVNSTSSYYRGVIVERTLWNVALTASEAMALALKTDPRRIQPASLVAYAPLIGRGQEIDGIFNQGFTHTGSTFGAMEPPLPYRRSSARRPRYVVAGATSVGASRNIKLVPAKSQPRGPTALINKSSSLANGLFVAIPNFAKRQGRVVINSATPFNATSISTDFNSYWYNTINRYNGEVIEGGHSHNLDHNLTLADCNSFIANSGAVTMCLLTQGRGLTGSTDNFAVDFRNGAGSANHYPYSDGAFYLGTFAGARWANGARAPAGLSVNDPHMCTITAKSGAQQLFFNGTSIATGTQAGVGIGSSNLSIGGKGASDQSASNATVYALWLWDRVLTAAEIQQMVRDPWQTFLQPERVQRSGGAAAAVVGGTTYYRSLDGWVTLAGVVAKETRRILTGQTTAAGALVRSTSRTLTGSSTPAGTLNKLTSRLLTGAATATGALSTMLLFTKSVVGSITPAGAVNKLTMRALAGTSTLTGSVNKALARTLSGSLTVSGQLFKSTSRLLSGSIAGAGAVGVTFFQSIAGSIAAAGALVGTYVPYAPTIGRYIRRFWRGRFGGK